jgi:Rod binding domain-containing protein
MGGAGAIGSEVGRHDVNEHEKAREVAQKFEGLIISSLLKSALGGEESKGLFGEGPGADVYQGFFETYMADHLARAGGLGLSSILERSFRGSQKP